MTAGRITTIVAAALLFLAPATMLTLRGGAGYCFFLLLAMGLATLVSRRGNRDYAAPLRAYPLYTLGMLAFAVVVPFAASCGSLLTESLATKGTPWKPKIL
jgi:hypothetical protein